jgi:hypothetical protein
MLNIVSEPGAFDPSSKHALFQEDGIPFEVIFRMGAGYPGSVNVLRPTYRHLGMIDWNDEDAARAIARKYLTKLETPAP